MVSVDHTRALATHLRHGSCLAKSGVPLTRSNSLYMLSRKLDSILWVAVLFTTLTGCGGQIAQDNVEKAKACLPGRGGVPDAAPLRRLSVREYAASVKTLTGVDPVDYMAGFPSDFNVKGLFDVEVAQQEITNSLQNGFRQVADGVSKAVMDPSKRATFVGCDPSVAAQRDTCLKSFIKKFATAAWRRPLTQEESDDFFTLASTQTDGWAAAGTIVYAVLQSPSYIFRPEFGLDATQNTERPGLVQLTPSEIAARLSFLFFGEAPGGDLLDASKISSLNTAEGIRTMAANMLSDQRARPTSDEFIRQWFALNLLSSQTRSTTNYASFAANSVAWLKSMDTEAMTMVHNNGWDNGSSFLDLFTTTKTAIDANLAKVYGVSNITSNTPVDFDFSTLQYRGGFFSTAAVLTVAGKNRDNPSIVGRGRWVKENIFCQAIPPPAPGTEISAPDPNSSSVEAANKHQTDPTCRGCHALMDPIGKGLERYDAIGALRDKYPNGSPLPTDGNLPMLNNEPFSSADQLGKIIHDSDDARSCVTQHLIRWTFARAVDTNNSVDACSLDAFNTTLKDKNYNLKDALLEFVTSDAFRFRAPVTD